MDRREEDLGGSDTLQYTFEPPTLKHDPLIGQLLGGRYQVVRRLGEGGFGAVYLATDEKMSSRNVVIKVLHKDEMSNEWSVKRFQQEIEALARIDHPAIVGIYDVNETDDATPYIVMQYVEGQTLRAVIASGKSDLARIANIVRQTGRALSAAHAKGILHRDLKPENIMVQQLLDGDEQVKIIDFGVAKVKNSKIGLNTGSDYAVGTVAYMSPEQLKAEPPTYACDVYSMGVIAYELMTGQRPLSPESVFQLLEMQRAGIITKPSQLRSDIPPLADQSVMRALSFESTARHQSAREFGDSLADALTGVSEETLNAVRQSPGSPPIDKPQAEAPVTASILFMDIVGYSKLLMDQQTTRLRHLQDTVLNSEVCRTAYDDKKCIRLPTGDGMALVFFGEPESAVRSALEITEALKRYPEIEIRMGINTGLVYRMADVNTNLNVAGGGINLAQRVMDCGDNGHILVSKRVADDLVQLSSWAPYLNDLGEVEVKHGVKVHIFNFYGDGFGNPEKPSKLVAKPKLTRRRLLAAVAAVLLVSLIVGAWFFSKSQKAELTSTSETPTPTVIPAGPQQSLVYWLTVQKTVGTGFGPAFQSTGAEVFGNGWRFQFNIQPDQAGALYLLNEGPGKRGEIVYDVLFPTPKVGGKPGLQAQQKWQTGWNYFQKDPGVEKLWILWCAEPVSDLDSIFQAAFKTGGRISATDVEKLRTYLARYGAAPPKVVSLKEQDRTVVSGFGQMLVSRVELTHKSY